MKFLQGVGKRADEHVELAFGPEQATVTDAAGRRINLPAETDGVRNPGSIAMRAEFLWKALRLGHGSLRFSPGGRMPLKATAAKASTSSCPASRTTRSILRPPPPRSLNPSKRKNARKPPLPEMQWKNPVMARVFHRRKHRKTPHKHTPPRPRKNPSPANK